MSVTFEYELSFIDRRKNKVFTYPIGIGADQVAQILQNHSFSRYFSFDYAADVIELIKSLEVRTSIIDYVSDFQKEAQSELIDTEDFNRFLKETETLCFQVLRVYSRFELSRYSDTDVKIELLSTILKPEVIENLLQYDTQRTEETIKRYGRDITELMSFVTHCRGVINYALAMGHQMGLKLTVG